MWKNLKLSPCDLPISDTNVTTALILQGKMEDS